jgi:arylsulfatase A-like enzyme
VQPADLMPTILDLAGVPAPSSCQGRSFVDVLRGETDAHRTVAVSGGAIDVSTAQDADLTVQDSRWCLIDRPDPGRRELYDKAVDPAQERDVLADHGPEVERLHEALIGFLRAHEAHPALVRWFDEGVKGDTSTYRHRPPYLETFAPYFDHALDVELHG